MSSWHGNQICSFRCSILKRAIIVEVGFYVTISIVVEIIIMHAEMIPLYFRQKAFPNCNLHLFTPI